MNVKTSFEQIYEQNGWGCGSGEGSLEQNTRGYRRFLQRFMRRHQVRSVVDLGCGDWQFSRLINWQGIQYLGIDIVGPLIRQNQELYASENIRFVEADIQHEELPAADLALVKDVFQHWPSEVILDFLPKLDRFHYTLIANCAVPMTDAGINSEVGFGGYRPLDLNAPPFSLGLRTLYRFTNYRGGSFLWQRPRWRKEVLLYVPRHTTN